MLVNETKGKGEEKLARATQVMPILAVEDMDRSLRFYRDGLGGVPVVVQPPEGPPNFVALRFGVFHIGIGLLGRPMMHDEPMRPASGHRLELRFYIEDVDGAASGLAAAGFEIVTPPTDRDWGERNAIVRDPDGNLVMLAVRLELV